MPTARRAPSTTATSVLNIRSGGIPSASLASMPYDSAFGSREYSCKVKGIFARSRAIVAMVPRPATGANGSA